MLDLGGNSMDELNHKKNLNRFWGIWNFIESIILLASGVLAIVVAVMNGADSTLNIESIIAYVVGAFIVLDGILRIVMSLAHYKGAKESDESSMLIGGFELTVGIVMMLLEIHFSTTGEHIFTYLIAHFIAILLIVIGLLLIIFSIITIAKKYAKLFMPILEILFSAILMGVGITILVLYYKDNNSTIVLVLTGSILSIAGVVQGIITFITLRKAKKEEKEVGKTSVINNMDYVINENANKEAKEVYVDDVNKNETKQLTDEEEIKKIENVKKH